MRRLRHRFEHLEAPPVLERRNLGARGGDRRRIDLRKDHAGLLAALGDDLQASADLAAPAHWQVVSREAPALPAGIEPLSKFVTGPESLTLRLSQIGVVDGAQGAEARAQLVQGQRLVSREGGLWRWDGFTSAPDAGTRASQARTVASAAKAAAVAMPTW